MKMAATEGPVAVLGATGRQGGAVVRHLLRSGTGVRALTRDPASEAARRLVRSGAVVVGADQRDEGSLRRAFDGARALFSVQDFYSDGGGPEGEVHQGAAVARAARTVGVPLVVQSTMAAGEHVDAVPHFLTKRRVEAALAEAGVAHVLLGTVWFMDNLFARTLGGLATLPVLAGALGRHQPVAALYADDIGAVVAAVIADPDTFRGRRLDLVGDRLSVAQMIPLLRRAGYRVPWWAGVPLPPAVASRSAPEFVSQLRWQRDHDFDVPVAPVSGLPALTTFSAFLDRERVVANGA